jgi:hypothetical protein
MSKPLYLVRHDGRAFISTDRESIKILGFNLAELPEILGEIRLSFDIPTQEIQTNALVIMLPTARAYSCPRCKWKGVESELKDIGIDFADGSPIKGCPVCEEHKLNEH